MTKKDQKHTKRSLFSVIMVVTCVGIALLAVMGENFYDSSDFEGIVLAGIPSSFDLRVLPTYKPVDFTSVEQGVCVGGNFANILSQTLADYHSTHLKKSIRLSAQQLLQCSVPNQNDICHHTTQSQIDYAVNYIQNIGLSTQQCYPFKPLQGPSECSSVCPRDKKQIDIRYTATISQIHKDSSTITDWIGTKGPVVLVINKHDGFNYYSSGILQNTGQDYGLVLVQVVGWKDQGKTLVCKSTFGQTWGINGYVHVGLNDSTIQKIYGFSLPQSSQL